MTGKPASVDEYIAAFPPEVQALLAQVRETIRAAAPEAVEKISYGMPAYALHGPLVYFAAYKKHIGFYPTGSGIAAFERELGGTKWSKGAVQFPLDRPIPYDLIARITAFRVEENGRRSSSGK